MNPAQIIQLMILANALLIEGKGLFDSIIDIMSKAETITDSDMDRILSTYEASVEARKAAVKEMRAKIQNSND